MLTVKGTEQLDDLTRLFKTCEAPIRKAMQAEAKKWSPELVHAAIARADSKVQGAIAYSGKTTLTAKGIKATFGSTGRVGNQALGQLARPYEFGTRNAEKYTTYLSRHRISKKAMRVKRRTQKQLPAWKDTGHFLYPAVAEATPRLVGRYVKAIAEVMRNG